MGPGQDDAIPLAVDFGQGVAQIWNRSVYRPRSAAIEAWGVTAGAEVAFV
jgi:hypothetical protein